jgi:hypothetical protein
MIAAPGRQLGPAAGREPCGVLARVGDSVELGLSLFEGAAHDQRLDEVDGRDVARDTQKRGAGQALEHGRLGGGQLAAQHGDPPELPLDKGEQRLVSRGRRHALALFRQGLGELELIGRDQPAERVADVDPGH